MKDSLKVICQSKKIALSVLPWTAQINVVSCISGAIPYLDVIKSNREEYKYFSKYVSQEKMEGGVVDLAHHHFLTNLSLMM